MSSKSSKTVIHWFRKGLRLHDNPALIEAIESATNNHHHLRPIFILDPLIPKKLRIGPNRWRFLQQTLEDLNKQLQNIGSKLYVIRGKPEEVFKRIFKEWSVVLLTFEDDIEPYAKERDKKVEDMAKECEVEVVRKISHTIYNPEVIIAKNLGNPPMTYQKFLAVAESLGKVPKPLLKPDEIPPELKPEEDTKEKANPKCYEPPTSTELGIVNDPELGPCLYPGGESEALKRLEKAMSRKEWVCNFEKPNTSPNSLQPSTTVLSPYLKFGSLSPRLFYHRIKETIGSSRHSKPPTSLIGQLMWREFYYTVGSVIPNYDQMIGNRICCQVDWDENGEFLEAWKFGRTGYPFIDAIMRQLRQEGWIHHLARHSVACFLTRGDLWISWEEGQKVFEEWLLDADWALNAGNWMWLSASAFFHQFFRVYSPVAFGKKTDKTGEYIRKYVPEVKKFPKEYIYEPWEASLSVQKSAGCIIGKDYPKRILVHEDVYKKNIGKMSAAYKANRKDKEQREQRRNDDANSGPLGKKSKKTNIGKMSSAYKDNTKEEGVGKRRNVDNDSGPSGKKLKEAGQAKITDFVGKVKKK